LLPGDAGHGRGIFMRVGDLIAEFQKVDPEKLTVVQVVGTEPGSPVWNCWLEVNDVPGSFLVQIKVWHPELKTLPGGEKRKYPIDEDGDPTFDSSGLPKLKPCPQCSRTLQYWDKSFVACDHCDYTFEIQNP
jgi:hypothetical protein